MNKFILVSKILNEINLFGLADKKEFKETDANPDELAKGKEVEKEHTKDENIATKIALDHLAEIPDYYSRLKKMEDEAKGAIE